MAKSSKGPDSMDSTELRNALEKAGISFPRGFRREELLALYREKVVAGGAKVGASSADHNSTGD